MASAATTIVVGMAVITVPAITAMVVVRAVSRSPSENGVTIMVIAVRTIIRCLYKTTAQLSEHQYANKCSKQLSFHRG